MKGAELLRLSQAYDGQDIMQKSNWLNNVLTYQGLDVFTEFSQKSEICLVSMVSLQMRCQYHCLGAPTLVEDVEDPTQALFVPCIFED